MRAIIKETARGKGRYICLLENRSLLKKMGQGTKKSEPMIRKRSPLGSPC